MDVRNGLKQETTPNRLIDAISKEKMFDLIEEWLRVVVVDLPAREDRILTKLQGRTRR